MKHYKLNVEEKEIVKKLGKSSIPQIFTNEYLDYLLMIENVEFYICEALAKGKIISEATYNETLADYTTIIQNTNQKEFDIDTINYFYYYRNVIQILIKYYNQ